MRQSILTAGYCGLLLMLLVIAACTVTPPTQTPPTSDTLPAKSSFETVDELSSFLATHQQSGYSGGYGIMQLEGDMMRAVGQAMPTAAMDSMAESSVKSYSDTNVQVEGIDEGDLIKTDGEYIYTISGQNLYILSAGEDAHIITSIPINGSAEGLFIQDDQLVLYGQIYDGRLYESITSRIGYPYRSSMTFVRLYDITDREDIQQTKEFFIEGHVTQTRMKDGFVYLVVNSYPEFDHPQPIIVEDGVTRKVALSDISMLPWPYESVQYTSVHTLELESRDLTSETILTDASHVVYMAHENLYLAHAQYINEWVIRRDITIDYVEGKLSDDDKDLVERIRSIDNDVLSENEKTMKVLHVISYHLQRHPELADEIEDRVDDELARYDYFEHTVITRLSIDGADVRVEATGRIPGTLINQFAMDERDDVLRVATTANSRWINGKEIESSNHVFTLDDDMEIIDHLKEVAPGERIYSTRFIDDRLYMVTFKQVDPFFVIDLSVPEDIEILGELKIPGFSNYLHPYDENIIIGLGQEADERGRTTGLKISLFDVSDVTKPQEIAKYVTDEKYGNSMAQYEHKAFLFDKDKELLVIPYSSWDDGESRQGALVFKITPDKIAERGFVDHKNQVERSLYIDELLYTKSYSLLRIHEIDSLDAIKDITFVDDRVYEVMPYADVIEG